MPTDALDTFLSASRLGGLVLSPDGSRLLIGVTTLTPDGKGRRTAFWELDPAGRRDARQVTRSRDGEGTAAFTGDGTLLFGARRPHPDTEADEATSTLWALPPDGGEAHPVCSPGAGIAGLVAAADADTVVAVTALHPAADTLGDDRARQQRRDDAGVGAQLFETYPTARWDHYLGPREPAVLRITDHAAPTTPVGAHPAAGAQVDGDGDGDGCQVEGGTGHAEAGEGGTASARPGDDRVAVITRGWELGEGDLHLSPDGRTLVASVARHHRLHRSGPSDLIHDLVAVDVRTGARRTVIAEDARWFGDVRVSPDGTRVAAVASDPGDPDHAETQTLVVVDLASGEVTEHATGVDVWPSQPRWLPGGDALLFGADEAGHRPVFRVDLASDEVTRLTADGAHHEVCVAADGAVYALRSTPSTPPVPVRLDADTPDQDGAPLLAPVGPPVAPAHVERLQATADDGTPVGSWLVRPVDADGDVPLVVFIHGGPLNSWNAWSWRWNPLPLVDAGYAVLLPDPALSTGYGQDFVQRGWGRWGAEPYTDLLAAVEDAADRDGIDGSRVAATGGSFGGYLANWIAGHTDRFACIITHASLWSLLPFHGTTDLGVIWEAQFGDPYVDPSRYLEHSPDRFVADIRTPMLVIHGEQDLRVPISEAQTLWTDLARHGVEARYLYFPDENHWVLKPNNARIWYRTFLAFLGEHLRDEGFVRPELL